MRLQLFIWISVVAGAAATVAHILSFFPTLVHVPLIVVFPLGLLIFTSFFIAFHIQKANLSGDSSLKAWKHSLRFVPKWVGLCLVLLFAYTGFNFLYTLFVLNEGLSPDLLNGQFVLHDHGNIVRILNEEEYCAHKAYELRGISTHLILFHALAAAVLWSEVRRLEKEAPPH